MDPSRVDQSDHEPEDDQPENPKNYLLRGQAGKKKISTSSNPIDDKPPKTKRTKANHTSTPIVDTSLTKENEEAEMSSPSPNRIEVENINIEELLLRKPASSSVKPPQPALKMPRETSRSRSKTNFTYKPEPTKTADVLLLPSLTYTEAEKKAMYDKATGKETVTVKNGIPIGTDIEKDKDLQIHLPVDPVSSLHSARESPPKFDQEDATLGRRSLTDANLDEALPDEPQQGTKSPNPALNTSSLHGLVVEADEPTPEQLSSFELQSLLSKAESATRAGALSDQIKDQTSRAIAVLDKRYRPIKKVVDYYSENAFTNAEKIELLDILKDCTDPKHDPARKLLTNVVVNVDDLQNDVSILSITTTEIMEKLSCMKTDEKKKEMQELLKKHLPQAAENAKIKVRERENQIGVVEKLHINFYTFFMFCITWLHLYKIASKKSCYFCRQCHSIVFLLRTPARQQDPDFQAVYFCLDQLFNGPKNRLHMRNAIQSFKKGLSPKPNLSQKEIDDAFENQLMPTLIVPGNHQTKADHECEKKYREHRSQRGAPAQALSLPTPIAQQRPPTGQASTDDQLGSQPQPLPDASPMSIAKRTRQASHTAAENVSASLARESLQGSQPLRRTQRQIAAQVPEVPEPAPVIPGTKVNVTFTVQDDGHLQLDKDEAKKFKTFQAIYSRVNMISGKFAKMQHFKLFYK